MVQLPSDSKPGFGRDGLSVIPDAPRPVPGNHNTPVNIDSDPATTYPNDAKEESTPESGGVVEKKLAEASEKDPNADGLADAEFDNSVDSPTSDQLNTLRREPGAIPWQAFTIAFVELCERFSYYGTTAVFVNFIQHPLPDGSSTGSAGTHGQPGALGMGQRASTGLTTFNQFWAYVMPLLGAYVADQYWGRFRTIQMSIFAAVVGHIILIISAIPPVIRHPNAAVGIFSLGLIIMGVGTGGFKSNISPLIAEQNKETRLRVTTNKKGERVIVDPSATVSRIFLYFYLCINVGSLVGQIGMVYAEKYVGFWLSFLLPTVLFLLAPIVLLLCKKHYVLTPPKGSVTALAWKTSMLAMRGGWSWNPRRTIAHIQRSDFWDRVKPSALDSATSTLGPRPRWMTFSDNWVDQLSRGLRACAVFCWFPIYWLSYNQMLNNLVSQAATMKLGGVPNDVINNLNPISLIIFIPIVDHVIYPFLRRAGIRFTPIKRITLGFAFASLSMVVACVIQAYIYRLGSCGNNMNGCPEPAPISVWVQTPAYVLIGLSEIMASVTGLEYAFTKAPQNMRSLVTAIFLLMNAFGAAINQAMVALSEDPLLVWNYGVVAVISAIGGIGFWFTHRGLDKEEDKLNELPDDIEDPHS